MHKIRSGCLVLLLTFAAGCRKGPPPAPVIGEAFAGPAQLKIRKDIPMESPLVATVRHGERLAILQRRRRFLRVRTPGGAEGWTDERLLLASEEMATLKELTSMAGRVPSQGKAGTYGELNVHTQPWRGAPTFLQLREGEKVEVLERRVLPRADLPRTPLIPPPPKKAPAAKKPKTAKEQKYPPPPMPKPPGPPSWWAALASRRPAVAEPAPEKAPPAPLPTDDWTLIRTASGQAGWVLTGRLVLSIPDDVAQYAEGRRITSYFALGSVQDGDQTRNHWLWTTVGNDATSDFDGFRVFIWSLRRHRYETAYMEKQVKGFAPVLLEQASLAPAAKGRRVAASVSYPGFSVCVEKSDGLRYRRSYAFLGNVVRFAGERPCDAKPSGRAPAAGVAPSPADAAPQPEAAPESLFQRFKKRLRDITRKWFGG